MAVDSNTTFWRTAVQSRGVVFKHISVHFKVLSNFLSGLEAKHGRISGWHGHMPTASGSIVHRGIMWDPMSVKQTLSESSNSRLRHCRQKWKTYPQNSNFVRINCCHLQFGSVSFQLDWNQIAVSCLFNGRHNPMSSISWISLWKGAQAIGTMNKW